MSKKRNIAVIITIILAILGISSIIYVNDYYHPMPYAMEVLNNSTNNSTVENVTITQTNDYIYFEYNNSRGNSNISNDNNISGSSISSSDSNNIDVNSSFNEKKGLIFYPGGKVAPESYAPFGKELAEKGYDVAIVKMPLNLAIMDSNKANKVIEDYPNVEWIIGGHSLGGTAASIYVSDNPEKTNGIVFLASYPYENLSNIDIKGLSIVGSRDGVLDKKSFDEAISMFPKNTSFETIDGGNHCYFGYYGFQSGDNNATISREKQEEEATEIIARFLASI